MADVETMYDQVQFLEDQQSYLKFLWWGNHDIYRGPHDYVICAHVFGATSSTSCSNYALRRAVLENEAVFGKAAASALHHKFYVDDLLKFLEDLDSANQLVKDFINMCKSGVFHLTKFISNNEELLLLVCHYQNIRRMGAKDQDLCGDLPNEKALGIC